MNRKKRLVVTAAALAAALAAPAVHADDGPDAAPPHNRVSAVRIVRDGAETRVRIEASRTPVFSVYTLHDPLRLVIDLSQGDVSRLETPIDVDDGVVGKIVTAQYGEGKRAIGRVIIGF